MEIGDLRETAALAHLNMGETELRGALPAFEQMLGYFAAMQAADEDREAFVVSISGQAEGMTASSRIVDSGYFREDTANLNSGTENRGETILSRAGERDGRFVVIPNVL